MIDTDTRERLQQQLDSIDAEMDVSELHGLLCGLLCAQPEDGESLLHAELFTMTALGDLLAQECQASVTTLYKDTEKTLLGLATEFRPAILDDDHPLRMRAASVRDWIQGFLYGLGLGRLSESLLSLDAQEVLQDFTDITRMNIDLMEENEVNEEAYAEIAEFLWVGVLTIVTDVINNKNKEKPA